MWGLSQKSPGLLTVNITDWKGRPMSLLMYDVDLPLGFKVIFELTPEGLIEVGWPPPPSGGAPT